MSGTFQLPSRKIAVEKLPNHPTVTTTSVSALTYGDDSGQQVILSPAWYPDAWPSPTKWRTNLTQARVTVRVSGTTRFGIVYSTSVFSRANVDGELILPRLGAVAVRAYETEGDWDTTAWTYGIRPQSGDAGSLLIADLDASKTYFIEVETTHLPDAQQQTRKFETLREVTTGLEAGEFWEITGFIADSGATFNNVTFTEPRKRFLILGDSLNSGFITPASGDTSILHRSASTYFASTATYKPPELLWNHEGALGDSAAFSSTTTAVGTATDRSS